ncbi:MAG TPA: hypothetical protein VGR63_07535, partial [Casimicrobiaceae bacterium]|nr:hypothetical protein [Casimicrobiaceae bacterium]
AARAAEAGPAPDRGAEAGHAAPRHREAGAGAAPAADRQARGRGGARRAFTGRKLVVHAGAPQNLDVRVGGTTHRLGSQSLWVATRAGLEPLRL